jgi:DNA-binding response OmpR family regulator
MSDDRAARPTERPAPVLVVEDDAHVRRTLEWTLEAEDLPVQVAPTGRRALELATGQRPSLVLLDIGLPDIDGYAVAAGVRAVHGDDVPILVLTADGRAAEKARQVGAVGYLSKPFELDELVATVKRLLQPL